MNIYVIVPHPDDEVLLCGATIVKHVSQGDIVTVCHAKRPEYPREVAQQDDALKAKKILGYHHLHQLYLSSTTLLTDFVTLKTAVEHAFACSGRIDMLYTTSGDDNHQDHRALFRAVSVATRPVAIKIDNILTGEIMSSTDQALGYTFTPNYYSVVKKSHVDKKINAMKAYSQETAAIAHPRSETAIRALAVVRGASICEQYAEAFTIMRAVSY